MARSFKKNVLFISRAYYHGGEGLEDLGLRIFYSMEDYQKQAEEGGWNDDSPSYKSSWCMRPIKISCWIPTSKRWKLDQQKLEIGDITITLAEAAELSRLRALCYA